MYINDTLEFSIQHHETKSNSRSLAMKQQFLLNYVWFRGPDGISALLLKTCAEELTPARLPHCPCTVEETVITPVPKKSCPVENNDYRPVALTSTVRKCLEIYIVSLLNNEVNPELKSWKFL